MRREIIVIESRKMSLLENIIDIPRSIECPFEIYVHKLKITFPSIIQDTREVAIQFQPGFVRIVHSKERVSRE